MKVAMAMVVVTALGLLKEPSVPWGTSCPTGYHSGEVSFTVFYPTPVTCGDISWAVRARFLRQDGERMFRIFSGMEKG